MTFLASHFEVPWPGIWTVSLSATVSGVACTGVTDCARPCLAFMNLYLGLCVSPTKLSPQLTLGPGKQSHYQVMSSLGGQTRSLLSNESAPCRVTCSQKTSLWPVPRGVQGKTSAPMEGSQGPCNDMRAPFSSSQFGNRLPRSKMRKFVILCEHKHALPSHRCCLHPFLAP